MTELWKPQPGPQLDAIMATWCPELFYGGAAGGGKSDFLVGDFVQDVPTYGGAWQGILFRKTLRELEKIIQRSMQIYPQTGGKWHEQKKKWTWGNGATLIMAYMEHERDFTSYQGHEYTWIGWDELTNWPTDAPYRMMISRLRSSFNVPTKRIRATANPGGVGHGWVKGRFIDPHPRGYHPFIDEMTGRERMFIPARLTDNRILMQNDPDYAAALQGVGSPELVRAWLEGDWTIIAGAYFPEFSMDKHVVKPHPIPEHWTKFRAIDWGSRAPFSIGWYAVSDGNPCEGGQIYPAGAIIKYREWYGATTERGSQTRVGLMMNAKEVAEGIKDRTGSEKIAYTVIDPGAFGTQNGPSAGEDLARSGVPVQRAANDRVQGWQQLRARLKGRDGQPALYFFSTCADTIRTLPLLQHDERKPEDVDTETEDHAGDETRYACMSRPFVTKSKETDIDVVNKAIQKALQPPTFEELKRLAMKKAEARRQGKR